MNLEIRNNTKNPNVQISKQHLKDINAIIDFKILMYIYFGHLIFEFGYSDFK